MHKIARYEIAITLAISAILSGWYVSSRLDYDIANHNRPENAVARIFNKAKTNVMIIKAPQPKAAPEPVNYTVPFVQPKFGNPQETFVHENGFEIGKTPFQHTDAPEASIEDAFGRPETVVVRYDGKTNASPDFNIPSNLRSLFLKATLSRQGKQYIFATDAWYENIAPCLKSIAKFAKDNKKPAVLVFTFKYKNNDDKAAEYVSLKAFSQKDLGKALSLNVTFHNFKENSELDYAKLSLAGLKD